MFSLFCVCRWWVAVAVINITRGIYQTAAGEEEEAASEDFGAKTVGQSDTCP